MHRRTATILVSLAGVLALTSCSEGGDSAGTTAAPSPASGEFCSLAQQVVATQTQIDTLLDSAGAPAQLEASLAAYLALLDDLRDAAPDALQQDVATTRTGFVAFDVALKGIDYDLARVAADPSLGDAITAQLQVMSSAEITTAMSNVDIHAVETCGFSLNTNT